MTLRETLAMRKPCARCGHADGHVEDRNGQAVVMCASCGDYQYCAPKKERGIPQRHVGRDGIAPAIEHQVALRAHFRCEICGRTAEDGVIFNVSHLVSVDWIRKAGLALRFGDHVDNLAWLCELHNLGMGRTTMPLHDLLVFLIRRLQADERPT